MAFEYRFNVIRFYSKLNRFVLSPRKKPNHFVLKIRPGGFADYTLLKNGLLSKIFFIRNPHSLKLLYICIVNLNYIEKHSSERT